MANMRFWIKQVLVSCDQTLNAILGGWADETLSSRAYRKDWNVVIKILDTLFFFEQFHCRESYESERSRLQLPPEFRV